MKKSATERSRMDHYLRSSGLPGLNDLGVMVALGFMVRDHEHFKTMLTTCEPEERRNMYESLRPHLRFSAKPLHEYLSEAAMEAERKQLPTWNEETKQFSEYVPPSVGDDKLATHAEQCIADSLNIAKAKGNFLTLKCARCTYKGTFSGGTMVDAVISARKQGWVYQKTDEREEELCPKCAAKRSLVSPEVGRA